MSILDRLRKHPAAAATPSDAAQAAPDAGDLPIPGYDRLDEKQIARMLVGLSQLQLDMILDYETAHKARPVVLDKLKYVRTTEPMPDYDTLEPDEILKALAGANSQTLKAVRDYERKSQRRMAVTNGVAELLPKSQASSEEARATAEKADRVSAKMRTSPGSSS